MNIEKKDHHQAFLWLALLSSVALHVLLLQVPGMRTIQPSPPNSMEVELVFVEDPAPEPDSPPETRPESPRIETTAAEPDPEPVTPEADTPEPDSIGAADQSPETPAVDSQTPLGYRVLQQVHLNHAGHATPDHRNRLQGAPAPRLPGQVGWLNDYVGTVTASSDHWRDPDGGMSSRLVMANGQVVCGHIRPLTVSEMFNPAMSLAVPMFRLCGRERPEPVDRSDPWVRGSGSRSVLE